MIDPTRLARAIYLTAKPIDVSTYRVRGGIADHMVEIVDGRCYCDCVDAQVRGPDCKHCLLVRLLGGDPEVVTALRGVVRSPDARSIRHRTPQRNVVSRDTPDPGGTNGNPSKMGREVDPGRTNTTTEGHKSR